MKNEEYQILPIENIDEIRKVVYDFDEVFEPPLSERIISLDVYIDKLYKNAIVYIAKGQNILGFIAFYANDKETRMGYISEIAVKPAAQGNKIGKALLEKCIEISRERGMRGIIMEVDSNNAASIHFHIKNGFKFCAQASKGSMYMISKFNVEV